MEMLGILIPAVLILFAAFMFSIGCYKIGGLAIFGVVIYVALALWMRRNKKEVEE